MEEDLGIAILKHLIEDEKAANGNQIDITDFVEKYIGYSIKEDVSIQSIAAASVISEMVNSGYLKEYKPEERRLNNYGKPQKDHEGVKGNTDIIVGITWKGKAFYYDHVKKGVLDSREKKGLYAVVVIAFITMVIAAIQLGYTVRQDPHKQPRTPITEEVSSQPSIEASIQKNEQGDTPPVSKKSSVTETLRERVTDKELLKVK